MTETALYETNATNASISASASETFFSADIDKKAIQKYNSSFNFLEIVNNSSNDLFIDLDGLTARRRQLFARSTMVIKAEQGIFFNNVKVTNQSASTAISASVISLLARIVRINGS